MDLDKNLLLSAAVIAISAASTTVLKLQSKEKKKRNRRIWVRSWVGRRDSKGIMNLVTNELLTEDPLAFKNYLRMSNTSLLKLLGKVENLISKQDTVMRQAIPAKHTLIIALRYLATGETFRNLMFSTRVHESTIAQFVPVVCRAIYSVLVKDYIKVHLLTYVPIYETNTCCALHNFLIAESNLYVQSVEHTPTTSNDQLGGIGQQIGNRPSNTAMQIREEFNRYFNGIGAVEWQNNMI
ncbi:hypothetical protein PPYR_07943 [Photinus pyralis]|uniref:Nuclease HARBI1 n=1 Tax=Photinus pyralis TaxID=7054 RepID=A0A5N4AS01_PHOPY|nr:hypothetical protein PPYR_07943 [Photinus pyralis]